MKETYRPILNKLEEEKNQETIKRNHIQNLINLNLSKIEENELFKC